MNKLVRSFLLGVLLLGLAGITVAQTDQSSTTTSDQGVKGDMKDAGHDTKDAAKKTGHKVKRGTKKVTHKGAKKTRHGAEKVEDKTQPPPQ